MLSRFFEAAKLYSADIIVRISGDCPCVDSYLVDDIVSYLLNNNVDYCSNTINPSYPDGLDIEAFNFLALKKAKLEAISVFDKEHVTPYIRRDSSLIKSNISNEIDYSHLRITLDEPQDLSLLQEIFKHFYPRIDFSWVEIVDYLNSNLHLLKYKWNSQWTIQHYREENASCRIGLALVIHVDRRPGIRIFIPISCRFCPIIWLAFTLISPM